MYLQNVKVSLKFEVEFNTLLAKNTRRISATLDLSVGGRGVVGSQHKCQRLLLLQLIFSRRP